MVGKSREAGENQSVTRALAILGLLAESAEPLGVRELARRLRVAPSNVQRLITTLARSGFLEQAEVTKRYTIGYRAFQVGNAFVGQSSLHSAVMPELYDLANQHITGFLGVRRGRNIVYLATVQSEGPVALTHRPGSQTYLHSTAMGKALLAEMPDDEVRALLGERPLPRLTAHTRISLQQLLGDLAEVRRVGYATSEEENSAGFLLGRSRHSRCVGAGGRRHQRRYSDCEPEGPTTRRRRPPRARRRTAGVTQARRAATGGQPPRADAGNGAMSEKVARPSGAPASHARRRHSPMTERCLRAGDRCRIDTAFRTVSASNRTPCRISAHNAGAADRPSRSSCAESGRD